MAPQDKRIAQMLREAGSPVLLVVNKTEGMREEVVTAEFHELAIGSPHAISAEHGEGVRQLIEDALAPFPVQKDAEEEPDHPRVAIIGRPNVGKSTLVNRLLGEERVIAFDQPGTTRDAIEVELDWEGQRYTLIDTAGIRRKGKVFEAVEKFSVIKTLQAIERAHVVILSSTPERHAEQSAPRLYIVMPRSLVSRINNVHSIAPRSARRKKDPSKLNPRLRALSDLARMAPASIRVQGRRIARGGMANNPRPSSRARAAASSSSQRRSPGASAEDAYAPQGGSSRPCGYHGSAWRVKLRKAFFEKRFRKTSSSSAPPAIELRSSKNPFEGKHKPLTEKQDSMRRRRKIISKRRYG